MWKPGLSRAVTLYMTVSPGRASAGATEAVTVTSFGFARGLLSFLAGLGVWARHAGGAAVVARRASAMTASAAGRRAGGNRREGRLGMASGPVRRDRARGPSRPRGFIGGYRNPGPTPGQAHPTPLGRRWYVSG